MRTYVGKLSDTKNTSEESMVLLSEDHADKIREADSGYSKKIRSVLGKGAWNKLSEESRIWLISAMMVYDYMKDVDRAMDFSGVCVQIGKACEYELRRRIFSAFIDYEISLYGEQDVYGLDRITKPKRKAWALMCLLFNDAELISLLFQPSEYLWQGMFEFVDAFERVVKRDDAAVAGVAFHVVHNIVGS